MALLKTSYLAGSRLARVVPEGLLSAGIRAGGTAWFTLSRGQHDAALENYAAVLRLPPDDPEVRSIARRAFHNYGHMLLDFTRIATLTRADIERLVTTDGTERIDRALQRGRGAILSLPHMGSWDMVGAIAGVMGYDIHAVAETFPGSLNDAVVTGREYFGMKVIPLGRSAVPRLIEVLNSNGVAALVTDIARGAGVEVEMFERRVSFAAGPASLALRTGAALLPVGVWSNGPGHYHGHVEPELIHEASGNRKADIRALTQRLADSFAPMIRAHPDQWYAFKPILQPLE